MTDSEHAMVSVVASLSPRHKSPPPVVVGLCVFLSLSLSLVACCLSLARCLLSLLALLLARYLFILFIHSTLV